MKHLNHSRLAIFIGIIALTSGFGATADLWQAVEEALADGLPRTAVENLDKILGETQSEKKYDEWLRALSEKVVIEATIQGNKPEEKVTRLKAEFTRADDQTRPLLQTILAQWYWHYYERNRWRFMYRTTTENLVEDDFTTWDLAKLFHEIDYLFQDILKDRERLTAIPTAWFLGFLEKGTMPAELRPTLYDFIAQEALNFYTSAEQAAARPEDAFEIDAGSGVFAPAGEFLKLRTATTDTASPKYKALVLYRSLMDLHRRQKNLEAFVSLDIERLNYLKNVAYGDGVNKLYIDALTALIDRNARYPVASLASYYLALAWTAEGDRLKAYETARAGAGRHPEAAGAECCRNYLVELKAKSLSLTGEDCIFEGASRIEVAYKNFTKIYFRIYRDSWNDFMKGEYRYPNDIDSAKIVRLLAKRPEKEWSADLPATDDLQERKIELDLPGLDPGYYRVFASWQADFENSTMIQHAWLWVSPFTMVSRTSNGMIDGLVLDARTGEPVAGADVVQIVNKEYRWFAYGERTTTDADGYFKFKVPDYTQCLLYVKKGDRRLLKSDELYVYRDYRAEPNDQMLFFTDRSLYRPGQTIHFKGIGVHVDQEKGDYRVLKGRHVTVYFRDANYQEIERRKLVTNDYGSVSGQFTAPADRLTGYMSISCSDAGDPQGYASLRVEEYKRPKFTVELETPREAVKLGQAVKVTGRARAYTGAPIDRAEVRYSVTRNVTYPGWWSWFYYRPNYGARQQIAHGRGQTDAEGNFTVAFPAVPDLKISPEEEPVFTFTIGCDVTSPDGETRSTSTSVRLGYSALAIEMSTIEMPCNNEPFPLYISTRTLDGNNLAAPAALKIYKLREPAAPIRPDLDYYWEESGPGGDETGEAGFGKNWMAWPEEKVAYETAFTTEPSNPETLDINLPYGLYRIDCRAPDKFGREVKALLPLLVLPDRAAKKFDIKLPSVAKASAYTVAVDHDLEVCWGTGYESGRCFVEIERDGAIVKRYWTDPGTTMHSFKKRVTEDLRGGFTVYLTQVRDNRAYLTTLPVYVPWDNKELDLTVETFRDKLLPGETEKMTLRIKGRTKSLDGAELVAALYDFSLDQFHPHNWYNFGFFKYAYSRRYAAFVNNTQNYAPWRYLWNEPVSYPLINHIHFPGYVIENFFYYRFPAISRVIYSRIEDFEGDTGVFLGTVTDAQSGIGLAGANVLIEELGRDTTTSDSGNFEIGGVPEGTYRVTASLAGYGPVTLSEVKSIRGQKTTLRFRLDAVYFDSENLPAATPVAQTETTLPVAADAVARAPVGGKSAYLAEGILETKGGFESTVSGDGRLHAGEPAPAAAIDLKDVIIRKNLNETAFFYPHLLMDKEGSVKIEFTIPEALTKWKFIGFAHGKACESGTVVGYTVTRKELMVQPNAPRFVREGDTIYFSAKVVNMSDSGQAGRVQLDFNDLKTEKPLDELLGLTAHTQAFEIGPHASAVFFWKVQVPRGAGPLSYTVAAKSEEWSDAEAGVMPVLSNRVLVSESVPLYLRGPEEKKINFRRLDEIGVSASLDPLRFTVQIASNPAWYAVQALPYIIEFPYECTEQVFNRYYANNLAGHIANSDTRIKSIFDRWRGTAALESNLEKNQELKSTMLMETPWVVEAQDETQAKEHIGRLFEEKTVARNLKSALDKLKNYQYQDGSWPWFPGGMPDTYMTMYIVTGFGRLKNLGVDTDQSLTVKALDYLDRWLKDIYDDCIKEANNLTPIIALYLYGRSFYLSEAPVPGFAQVAFDYFIKQAEEYWLGLDSRLSQGYLALAMHRLGKDITAGKVMASLKERSVQDEELGMFWREDELSWWWYRAPIETQALMIEAFSEVTGDTTAVEDCRVWLLKQKQTQNWKTTKATADAVYALVLRGTDLLGDTSRVEIRLGNVRVEPEKVEAGTGFYEKIYQQDEIRREFSEITLRKPTYGIAWGGAHLQYFEDLSKITAHKTGLQLEKTLWIKKETEKGRVLAPLKGRVQVGDLITVRLVLRADRDMEYVHLKDMRGSGLEPVDVLSYYKYQDGLRYYQATLDAATNFFIDYLPKGIYIFEYDLRVQLRGRYENGIASIQCLYAPEFNSHSASEWLEVR